MFLRKYKKFFSGKNFEAGAGECAREPYITTCALYDWCNYNLSRTIADGLRSC